MFRISKDSPVYYLTCVTHDRLPVFQGARLKDIVCKALNEARTSAQLLFFAYVVMPDHYHVITDSSLKASEVLRYLNGISARRVINYLKEEGYTSSLSKLRRENSNGDHKYSLWEHHSNTFLITSESMLMNKAHYIHQNPIEEGLAVDAAEYRYSSFRYWARRPLLDEEPIEVDIKDLSWRRSR